MNRRNMALPAVHGHRQGRGVRRAGGRVVRRGRLLTNAPAMSASLRDRACDVLLGTAVGDALGGPYEFGTPPRSG